jgi:hypothetical protein
MPSSIEKFIKIREAYDRLLELNIESGGRLMINTAEQLQQQAEAQSISDQMRKLRQKVRE